MADYKRPPFIVRKWYTFKLDNKRCFGVGFIENNEEAIALVDEDGQMGFIPYVEIEAPTLMEIFDSPVFTDNNKPMSFASGEA